MLERGWREESAELLGVAAGRDCRRSRCRSRARAARRAATPSPGTKTSRSPAGCGCAAAARPARRGSRRAIRWSNWRPPRCSRQSAGASAPSRRRCSGAASPPCCVARGTDRLGHPAAARHPDPAACSGPASSPRRCAGSRCRCAASVGGAVVGYLSLWTVATLYKLIRGKEGMGRRLQAARRPRRLDRLADDSADRPALVGDRRRGRARPDRLSQPRPAGAASPSAPFWPAAGSPRCSSASC